jgi:hypothetical protein
VEAGGRAGGSGAGQDLQSEEDHDQDDVFVMLLNPNYKCFSFDFFCLGSLGHSFSRLNISRALADVGREASRAWSFQTSIHLQTSHPQHQSNHRPGTG